MSLHASSWLGDGRTLCGLADEAGETEDDVEPVRYAEVGKTVTCAECIACIKYCQDGFTYKYRVRAAP